MFKSLFWTENMTLLKGTAHSLRNALFSQLLQVSTAPYEGPYSLRELEWLKMTLSDSRLSWCLPHSPHAL